MRVLDVIHEYKIDPETVMPWNAGEDFPTEKRLELVYSHDIAAYSPFGSHQLPTRHAGDRFTVLNIFDAARDHQWAEIVGHIDGTPYDPADDPLLQPAEIVFDPVESSGPYALPDGAPNWYKDRVSYAAKHGYKIVEFRHGEALEHFDNRNRLRCGWIFDGNAESAGETGFEAAPDESLSIDREAREAGESPEWYRARVAFANYRGYAYAPWRGSDDEQSWDKRNFGLFGWRYEDLNAPATSTAHETFATRVPAWYSARLERSNVAGVPIPEYLPGETAADYDKRAVRFVAEQAAAEPAIAI